MSLQNFILKKLSAKKEKDIKKELNWWQEQLTMIRSLLDNTSFSKALDQSSNQLEDLIFALEKANPGKNSSGAVEMLKEAFSKASESSARGSTPESLTGVIELDEIKNQINKAYLKMAKTSPLSSSGPAISGERSELYNELENLMRDAYELEKALSGLVHQVKLEKAKNAARRSMQKAPQEALTTTFSAALQIMSFIVKRSNEHNDVSVLDAIGIKASSAEQELALCLKFIEMVKGTSAVKIGKDFKSLPLTQLSLQNVDSPSKEEITFEEFEEKFKKSFGEFNGKAAQIIVEAYNAIKSQASKFEEASKERSVAEINYSTASDAAKSSFAEAVEKMKQVLSVGGIEDISVIDTVKKEAIDAARNYLKNSGITVDGAMLSALVEDMFSAPSPKKDIETIEDEEFGSESADASRSISRIANGDNHGIMQIVESALSDLFSPAVRYAREVERYWASMNEILQVVTEVEAAIAPVGAYAEKLQNEMMSSGEEAGNENVFNKAIDYVRDSVSPMIPATAADGRMSIISEDKSIGSKINFRVIDLQGEDIDSMNAFIRKLLDIGDSPIKESDLKFSEGAGSFLKEGEELTGYEALAKYVKLVEENVSKNAIQRGVDLSKALERLSSNASEALELIDSNLEEGEETKEAREKIGILRSAIENVKIKITQIMSKLDIKDHASAGYGLAQVKKSPEKTAEEFKFSPQRVQNWLVGVKESKKNSTDVYKVVEELIAQFAYVLRKEKSEGERVGIMARPQPALSKQVSLKDDKQKYKDPALLKDKDPKDNRLKGQDLVEKIYQEFSYIEKFLDTMKNSIDRYRSESGGDLVAPDAAAMQRIINTPESDRTDQDRTDLESMLKADTFFKAMKVLTAPLLANFVGYKTYGDTSDYVAPDGSKDNEGDFYGQVKRAISVIKNYMEAVSEDVLSSDDINQEDMEKIAALRDLISKETAKLDALDKSIDSVIADFRHSVEQDVSAPDYFHLGIEKEMRDAEEKKRLKDEAKEKKKFSSSNLHHKVFGYDADPIDSYLSGFIQEIDKLEMAIDAAIGSVSKEAVSSKISSIMKRAERIEVSDMYSSYDMSGNMINLIDSNGVKKLTISNKLRDMISGKEDLEMAPAFSMGDRVGVESGNVINNGTVVAYLGKHMYKVNVSGINQNVREDNIFKI